MKQTFRFFSYDEMNNFHNSCDLLMISHDKGYCEDDGFYMTTVFYDRLTWSEENKKVFYATR